MSFWPGCQGRFFTKKAVFCCKNTLQPFLGTQTLFHMYCKWIRGILAGAPLLRIYKNEAKNEREILFRRQNCPARHSDPLSNLKNINSSSLSKNSITNYYVVDTFLEEGNPSISTAVSITLFSLIDGIYEMPHTQEPLSMTAHLQENSRSHRKHLVRSWQRALQTECYCIVPLP